MIDVALSATLDYFSKDVKNYLSTSEKVQLGLFFSAAICVILLYFGVFSREIHNMKTKIDIYKQLLSIIPLELITKNAELLKEYTEQIKILTT